jgi:hypothetical protein
VPHRAQKNWKKERMLRHAHHKKPDEKQIRIDGDSENTQVCDSLGNEVQSKVPDIGKISKKC